MPTSILLIEDARFADGSLSLLLESQGFEVERATRAEEGLALFAARPLHAVLIDSGPTGDTGQKLVLAIRAQSQVPIVVVSSRHSESDQISALDSGANAYIPKPFRKGELLARLRAVLRRAALRHAGREQTVDIGPLHLQLEARRATVDGKEVELTATEFSMLEVMALQLGSVVTHRQLLQEVWGANSSQDANRLRVFICRLRRKLQPKPNSTRLLYTAPGVGYKLWAPDHEHL